LASIDAATYLGIHEKTAIKAVPIAGVTGLRRVEIVRYRLRPTVAATRNEVSFATFNLSWRQREVEKLYP
jgi:hypothetical protein